LIPFERTGNLRRWRHEARVLGRCWGFGSLCRGDRLGRLRGRRRRRQRRATCTPISDTAPYANECAGGLCFTLDGKTGTCVGVVALGAACDDMHLCFDFDGVMGMTGSSSPLTALRCVADDPLQPAVAHCQPRLADGSMCKSSSDCQSATCSGGACAPKLAVGATCAVNSECASGLCDSTMKVCAALKAIGAPCGVDGECASTACKSGACVPAICGG
jgi:hypothetical protein